jgi:elongation factor Ts
MAGTADVKTLRERTGAGILDCKKALGEAGGDMEAAIDWLRAKGIAKAAKRAGREATEGLVGAYVHAGGAIGVLVEVNCETDFVARTDQFKELVHGLAMHIAAADPSYLSRDEVPADAMERERTVQLQRVIEEGKPAQIAEKIVGGRISKWYEDVCLLDQNYVKDDSKTVAQLVQEVAAILGENLRVRRFARFAMGEGLVKEPAGA